MLEAGSADRVQRKGLTPTGRTLKTEQRTGFPSPERPVRCAMYPSVDFDLTEAFERHLLGGPVPQAGTKRPQTASVS
jgi:hypothetical protein